MQYLIFIFFFYSCQNATTNHFAKEDTSGRSVISIDTSTLNPDPPLTPASGGRSIDGRSLEVGDILFSTTNNVSSIIIRRFTGGGPASHVAVVSDLIANTVWVVEAVTTTGVRKISLDDFLSENSFAAAFRYPSISSNSKTALVQYLNERQGRVGYDYYGAAASPYFRLSSRQVQVDYGQRGSQKTYCSKLYIEAMQHAGISILSVTGGWSTPNDLVTMSWTNDLHYVGHLKYTP